jgi:putative membrane protein
VRKTTLMLALLAAAAPLPLASAAFAASLDQQDKMFVEEAAHGGVAEVEMGKLAGQKAESAAVKQFGERMVQDHTQANQKLMTAVKGKMSGELPTKPDAKQQKEMQELQGMSGSKFDQAYMRTMIQDHVKDVEKFQHAAKEAKDPEVKHFAEETLPVLQEHLKMARQVGSDVGVRG